ncbi:hypothetical protein ACVWWG_000990 [Bradyrhizobium sp. LB7.2]
MVRAAIISRIRRLFSPQSLSRRGAVFCTAPCCFCARRLIARPVSRVRQSSPGKIFYFTEIRFWRMCRPSRLTLEGRPCVVMVVEPGLRWTRQRRARKCGQGGLLSVSPRLRVDERRCQVRLVIRSAATCTTSSKPVATSEPCVRQNRVVLAVVATVQAFAEAAFASTGAVSATFVKAREANRNSAPGRARHKP